jgi:signal transduction histidine kinase
MHSATLELRPASVVKNDELGRFCATMSQGLHALAQPLTIVRSAVAALSAPGVSAQDQRRYMELSAQHVERTCGLFECLQELVIASQIDADCEPLEFSEAIANAIEDRDAALQASGIKLRIVMPDILPQVHGDATRTQQALSAALNIAATISSPGDVVELLATHRNGFVELNLQNDRIHGRAMNSLQRLTLALAEVNIRSQQGKYECAEDPLRVFIALPLQDGLP